MNIPTKKLESGFELPVYGLGIWQMGGRWEADTSKDEEEIRAIEEQEKEALRRKSRKT